ncbi:MAG: DUF1080 domain-containing protein [Verrucomicrobiota bacterium]
MKKLRLIFLVGLATLRLTAGEPRVNQSLFNGTNLAGWTPMSGGQFYVTNGVIRAEGGKGWLRTEQTFTNFILELEWRGLETNYNSGIFVRAPLEGSPWATNVWQVNTKQSAVGELLEGSAKIVPVNTPKLPAGEWCKFRIEARGRELTLDVNGQQVWKFAEFTPTSGFLGLQAEGKTFEFRNLSVQVLP